MPDTPKVVATFTDKYGEERVVHKKKNGLAIKRNVTTPALALNQPISKLIGKKIRKARLEKGFTLIEVAIRAGMNSGHPKERIWAIENATRSEGVRMGTLYALAMALEVEPSDLMPTLNEINEQTDALETIPLMTLKLST